MRARPHGRLIVTMLAMLPVGFASGWVVRGLECPPASSVSQTAVVTRVLDGDTLALATGEKVRLIGVDTPETKSTHQPVQAFGTEAAALTRRLVEGHRVCLEDDHPRRDHFGRLLASVYRQDGTFVNAEMIRQGYGVAYTRFRFQSVEYFRPLEQDARQAKQGMWREW